MTDGPPFGGQVEPISSAPPPLGRTPMLRQRWSDLAFLHWRVDPAAVAPLLPPGTVPDIYDGATWVGLIPFMTATSALAVGPDVPWLGTFAETNVRFYSVDATGRRGIVFRSMEAQRLLTVLGARVAFNLPYTWAKMGIGQSSAAIEYASTRRWPGPRGAGGKVVLGVGGRLAEHDPLSDFLTARWGLHTAAYGRTLYIPAHHERWPLHAATLQHLDDTLVAAAGFPGLVNRPPESVLWSPGVRVTFGFPYDAGRHRSE